MYLKETMFFTKVYLAGKKNTFFSFFHTADKNSEDENF